MAKMTPKGLSGIIGPVDTYVTEDGTQILRSRRRKQPKKKGHKPIANRAAFGTISTYGTPLITGLKDHLNIKMTSSNFNKMRGWMGNEAKLNPDETTWKLAYQSFSNHQFNPKSSLGNRFRVAPEISTNAKGQVTISFPSFNPFNCIMVPEANCLVHIKAVAVSSSFQNGEKWVKDEKMEELVIEHKNKDLDALTMVLPMKASPGDIALVVLYLEYEVKGKIIQDPKWLPAAAIAFGPLKPGGTTKTAKKK
jgi:hypothetical protein